MAKISAEMLEGTIDIIEADSPASDNKSDSISNKTKKNFETLMQPCGVLEADFALQAKFNAYACSQLETVTNRIKQCVYNISSNFIEIGFRLWECERYKYYSEMGYNNICDYALSELGFKKSSTRNFIRVYERFCNHEIVKKSSHTNGPSVFSSGDTFGKYFLLSKYKNFTYSQLTELLSLSDEQIKVISPTPEDSVRSIRDKKQELHEASEQWLHDSIIKAVGGNLGFKKQIYDHYMENKSVGKLASFIKDHMLKIESGGVFFDDGSYCRFNIVRITFFHSLYFPEDKVFRWFDLAEKVAGYIESDTFLSEQVHIDEISEVISDEMIAAASDPGPEADTIASDEQRPYMVSLYKQDIDLILSSLRAADVPQDDYDRIYEIIGKAEF